MSKIEVKSAGKKGRGVFAIKPIKKGEVIEVAHYIEIPATEYKFLRKTTVNYYWYEVDGLVTGIGLGNTSLYNHSSAAPNSEFEVNKKKKKIIITALQNIKAGQEVLFDYGYDGCANSVSNHKKNNKL